MTIAKQKPEIFTLGTGATYQNKVQYMAMNRVCEANSGSWLPSSKINILLENKEYMTMMKEKLLEIKRIYRNLELAPLAGRC